MNLRTWLIGAAVLLVIVLALSLGTMWSVHADHCYKFCNPID